MSIYDVAKRAGVSITTVSHVFSGRRPVAEDTAARVLEAARELNYRPRLTAQGLATGRRMVLGVHFPLEGELLIHNPYFPELLEGFSAAAARAGNAFLLIPRNTNEDDDLSLNELLGQVDGVIIADPATDDPIVGLLLDHELPIVTTGRYLADETLPWVDNDHQQGIQQVFDHLSDGGYQRLMLISSTHPYSYTTDLETAYLRLCREHGIEPRIARAEDLSDGQAYAIARDVLDAPDRPDAIIAYTDQQAVAVLREAKDLDIAVPADLAVIGEGDTVLARNAIPSLTSIQVHPQKLGQLAIELMLDLLDGETENLNRVLAVDLVPRDSSTRPEGSVSDGSRSSPIRLPAGRAQP